MKKIDELKNKLDNKRKEMFEIKNAIQEIQTKEILPELKEKHEGKFYKYQNRMSGEEWWWLYLYCREVKCETWGVFDKFQTTPYQSEFKSDEENLINNCRIEITRDEYQEAFTEFSNKLSELKRIYNN